MQENDTIKSVANQCHRCANSSHEVKMRWFILFVIAIGLLASLATSITLTLLTRNPVALALPSSVLLVVLPIIRYLFPQRKEKGVKSDQEA